MSRLYLVPTPIGNLGDITLRAIEVLKTCDSIICEDTRVTGRLLKHLGIGKPLQSFHTHNEHRQVEKVIEKLHQGEVLAMTSDAGTPGISDPGFLLVRACVEAGIPVECLPGATAIIPAIVVSGFAMDRFVFEGFLPHKKGRQKKLEQLKDEVRTMVFYESPHRLLKALEQMKNVFGGDRRGCICREISKMHEEHVRGTLDELMVHFSTNQPRGEIVMVIEGSKEN